jgi:hypothetical protein
MYQPPALPLQMILTEKESEIVSSFLFDTLPGISWSRMLSSWLLRYPELLMGK